VYDITSPQPIYIILSKNEQILQLARGKDFFDLFWL